MFTEIKGKLYFGHPVNVYNTPDEKRLCEIISREFPNAELENPNSLVHDECYKKWKQEKGSGMKYFFEEVLPKMSAGVFLPFSDGLFGKGVYGEAEQISNQGGKIFEVNLEGKINIMTLDSSKCLSVEETRKRVYGG